MEKVQKGAFRIIYAEVENTDINALRIAQSKPLSEMRQDIREQTFTNTQDTQNSILPLLRSNKHDRELGNSSYYCFPRCRTERYKKFYPKMGSTYNSEQ